MLTEARSHSHPLPRSRYLRPSIKELCYDKATCRRPFVSSPFFSIYQHRKASLSTLNSRHAVCFIRPQDLTTKSTPFRVQHSPSVPKPSSSSSSSSPTRASERAPVVGEKLVSINFRHPPEVFSSNSNAQKSRKSLTILVHAHLETLFQTARLTLVPMGLVDDTQTGARLTSAKEEGEGRK